MPEPRPVTLTAAQVRAALAGETVELRRKLRPSEWRLDGCTGWNAYQREHVWPAIVWDAAEPSGTGPCWLVPLRGPNLEAHGAYRICPRIRPGDRLWVREAMGPWSGDRDLLAYAADDALLIHDGERNWPSKIEMGERVPARLMPRSHSRLTLVVTGLRLEPGEPRPFVVEARKDG